MQWKARAKRYSFWILTFVGLYTLLACLSAAGVYVSQIGLDKPSPLGPVLRQEFKSWLACAGFSLGVLWFCQSHPFEQGRTRRWVLVHFVAALILSLGYILFTSWWVAGEQSVMHPGKILTFAYLVKEIGLHCLVLNLILYCLVVFAHTGWHFHQRYRERELQTAGLQRELTQARLDALRMQLNPHFLFNTLHAISSLIHENPEDADRMIARLSEMLRLSLDQSKPAEVPLHEELAFLERYLEIEQTRFSDRLHIDQQIAADVREALVPYLILQPLVENAIRHGIEPREDHGYLTISARRQDGMLQFRISDNGPGLGEDAPERVQEGIGLSNTRSRLRHLYGPNGRLKLISRSGGGLDACLDLPFHTTPSTSEHDHA